MKKTLVALLVVVLVLGTFGTVSFAAETEMTPIPDGPALTQRYAHMQADNSVLKPGDDYAIGDYARGVAPTCSKCGINHTPFNSIGFEVGNQAFTKWDWHSGWGEQLAKEYASYSTAYGVNGAAISKYGFFRAGGDYNNSFELAFEKLGSDSGEKVKVNSGYLMLHNDGVRLRSNYSSFGFGLVSGEQVGCTEMRDDYLYVAVVADGGKTYLQFLNKRHPMTTEGWSNGGYYQEMDISDYVEYPQDLSAGYFDLKVLADLNTDTYSIYINNRPVVLSCRADAEACPDIGGINFSLNMTAGWYTMFKTTTCYPMSEAEVNQFRQATWERAFNSDNFVDVPNLNQKGIRLFAAWGGNQAEYAPEFDAFYDCSTTEYDNKNKMSLKHEGIDDIQISTQWIEPAGCNYNGVYLTGTNFENTYDYDKLNLVILTGEPTLKELDGTVSGTYIAAGGLGMKNTPRVLSASYTKNGEVETLYDAKITEGLNGVYSGAISEIDIPETENRKLAHYIWGGLDRITPLFEEVVLPQ